MAPEQKSEIVDNLEKSRQEFHRAVAGVSESHATRHPEPGRWSVLDCVEHVTIVEERFLGYLESAPRLPEPRVDKQKEADLAARIPNRANKADAPEPVRPVGRFTTLAQALERFNGVRARTLQFAEGRSADLYHLASEHPRFGPLNGMEFLIIIAGHARRHAAQIHEVRAALSSGE
jgi:hypothetical protein